MKTLSAMTLALAWALAVACAWAFQWQAIELHPSGDKEGAVILVNRWTGEVRYAEARGWIVVPEVKRK